MRGWPLAGGVSRTSDQLKRSKRRAIIQGVDDHRSPHVMQRSAKSWSDNLACVKPPVSRYLNESET